MLESRRIEEHYPELGQPRLTRIGVRAGWTRSVVRTAAGVTIESIGLDKAVRGARELENRPDFIAFDDIDGLEDTFATIEKKERTILQTILPAGSGDAAVAIVQNLITDRGIVARLAGIADQVVDYLQGRIVSGPHPAVRNLRLEMVEDEWRIVDGEPTWDGQSLETCQNQIAEWGPTAFLSEAQHDVFARSGGMFDKDYFDIVPELPSGRNLEFCRYWDKAGTRDAGAHTAGLLLARDGSTFYIVDLEMGQWEAPERERRILRTAHLDEERFGAFGSIRTGVEQEPGSSGKESAESTVRMLSEEGFSAFADSPTGDKVLRAEPVAKLAELGAIKMVAGAYNDRLLRILHGFPKGTIKDPVDALSGAYKKLSRSSNSAEIARRLGRVERFSSPWLRER